MPQTFRFLIKNYDELRQATEIVNKREGFL